ncbi:MAG: geranylgeranylglyceryl/heptaprenylglyceryl phosphate synthase, partial [bacterium]
MTIYSTLCKKIKTGKKSFAVLVDPDKTNANSLEKLAKIAVKAGVDYFFFGGSLLTSNNQESLISCLKNSCEIPVLLFSGNSLKLT